MSNKNNSNENNLKDVTENIANSSAVNEEEIVDISTEPIKNNSSYASGKEPKVNVENIDEHDMAFTIADDEKIASVPNLESKPKNNKAVIITSASIAAVILVSSLTGMFILNNNNTQNTTNNTKSSLEEIISTEPETTILTTLQKSLAEADFRLVKGISVNGVDIGEKTVETARELLEKKAKELRTAIKIDVTANNKTFSLTEDNFKFTNNIEAILQHVVEDSKKNKTDAKYDIICELDFNSIDGAINKAADGVDVPMKEAYVSKFNPGQKNKFVFAEGTVGYVVDRSVLKSEVTEMLSENKYTGKVSLDVKESKPTLTAATLKKQIVPLSGHTTYSTNTEDGTHNMALALEKCNGSIIEPGGTWSFNGCTGDSTTLASGFRYANVIANGQLEQGIGGGICQASTTIFNSAIYANLGVVERYNHRWASSYAKSGLDATIDYPALDLKLKNNTKYQIFLECYMDGRTLVANFYGWKDPAFDKVGTYSTNYDINSGENYKTDAYRIYYKNGKETKRQFLCSSFYYLDQGHWVAEADSGTIGGLPGSDSTAVKVAATTQPTTKAVSVKPTQKATQPATKPAVKPTAKPATKPAETVAPTEKPTQPVTVPPITIPPATTMPQSED